MAQVCSGQGIRSCVHVCMQVLHRRSEWPSRQYHDFYCTQVVKYTDDLDELIETITTPNAANTFVTSAWRDDKL